MSIIALPRMLMLGCAAAAIVGTVIVWHDKSSPNADTTTVDGGASSVGSSGSFRIAGDSTRALAPGRTVSLNLLLTNPHTVALTLTGLSVRVSTVSAPNADGGHPCSTRDFAVTQPAAGLTIRLPARASKTMHRLGIATSRWPSVTMLDRQLNQDGCKGASLTLGYAGSGTPVSR